MRWLLRVALVPVLAVCVNASAPARAQADRDCADFTFQEDAQAFFVAQGGPAEDPNDLDADGDGVACEELPHRSATNVAPVAGVRTPRTPRAPRTSASQPAGQVGVDRDCSDFRTQPEAQAFFEAQGPGDPHGLDADNDGLACESLPVSRASSRTALPTTGTRTASFAFSGMSLLAVGFALVMIGRRRTHPADVGDPPLIGW